MSKIQRRHFTREQKVAIPRDQLFEKIQFLYVRGALGIRMGNRLGSGRLYA